MERLQRISVDLETVLKQLEWRESLRNTPHPRINSPCKSCTNVVRQHWSVIVKSLKRKTGTDTWNIELMTLQKTKSTAYDSAFLRQPNHQHLYIMLPEPGPHLSARHSDARTVQYVSFNHRVSAYPADDYDRRGPWMHAAVDIMRFRRRIEQTELILAPVLNKKHRRIIPMCRCNI